MKEKKILIIGYIIVGLIFFMNRDEIRVGKINPNIEDTNEDTEINQDVYQDVYQEVLKDVEGKTGECYVRVNGRRKICGKVVDGKPEGKWIFYNKNGDEENEIMYKDGKEI